MTRSSVAVLFAILALLAEGVRLSEHEKVAKQYPSFGQGFNFGGWAPPPAPCQMQQNTWGVASCLFGMSGGNLHNIFPTLAGPDGQIDMNEWKSRVANTAASIRIFITLASQELRAGSTIRDDSTTIDWDDWAGFVQSAQAASGAQMDANEWADYVSASVTAEALFDAANGHAGQYGFYPGDNLNFQEWATAFYKVGGADGSVTLVELARAVGLYPNDVHKVFTFIENVGSACDRGWMNQFQAPGADAAQINQCEWNQLLPAMQRFQPGLPMFGVSKGTFSKVIAQMVTAHYKTNPYARYPR